MNVLHRIKRFLANSDGFMLSTERIVLLSMTFCVLVVGLIAVRNAIRDEFLDEVDAVAACTNVFLFNQAAAIANTYDDEFTDDFESLFPELSGDVNIWPDEALRAPRPEPTPASKEAADQGFSGDKENSP